MQASRKHSMEALFSGKTDQISIFIFVLLRIEFSPCLLDYKSEQKFQSQMLLLDTSVLKSAQHITCIWFTEVCKQESEDFESSDSDLHPLSGSCYHCIIPVKLGTALLLNTHFMKYLHILEGCC